MQDGKPRPLLPALEPKYAGKKCLVLDLDETLVHSSLRVRSLPLRLPLVFLIVTYSITATACPRTRLHRPRRDREQLAQLLCP